MRELSAFSLFLLIFLSSFVIAHSPVHADSTGLSGTISGLSNRLEKLENEQTEILDQQKAILADITSLKIYVNKRRG